MKLMYLELFSLASRVLYIFKRIVFALLKLELKVNCKIELVAMSCGCRGVDRKGREKFCTVF